MLKSSSPVDLRIRTKEDPKRGTRKRETIQIRHRKPTQFISYWSTIVYNIQEDHLTVPTTTRTPDEGVGIREIEEKSI